MAQKSKGKLPIHRFAYHDPRNEGLYASGYGGSRHRGKLDTGILMSESGIAGMLYQGDIATLFLDHVYFLRGVD